MKVFLLLIGLLATVYSVKFGTSTLIWTRFRVDPLRRLLLLNPSISIPYDAEKRKEPTKADILAVLRFTDFDSLVMPYDMLQNLLPSGRQREDYPQIISLENETAQITTTVTQLTDTSSNNGSPNNTNEIVTIQNSQQPGTTNENTSPLPDGWNQAFVESENRYIFYNDAGFSTFDRPVLFPQPKREIVDLTEPQLYNNGRGTIPIDQNVNEINLDDYLSSSSSGDSGNDIISSTRLSDSLINDAMGKIEKTVQSAKKSMKKVKKFKKGELKKKCYDEMCDMLEENKKIGDEIKEESSVFQKKTKRIVRSMKSKIKELRKTQKEVEKEKKNLKSEREKLEEDKMKFKKQKYSTELKKLENEKELEKSKLKMRHQLCPPTDLFNSFNPPNTGFNPPPSYNPARGLLNGLLNHPQQQPRFNNYPNYYPPIRPALGREQDFEKFRESRRRRRKRKKRKKSSSESEFSDEEKPPKKRKK